MPDDDAEQKPQERTKGEEQKNIRKLRIVNLPTTVKIIIYGAFLAIPERLGTSLLNSHPKPLLTAWSLIFIGFCIFGIIVRTELVNHKHAHKLPDCLPNTCLWGIITFGFVGCVGAVLNERPDDPYLEPTLVIDSVSSSNVLCHYDIHNSGKALARDVLSKEEGGGGFVGSQFVPVIREISENGTAAIVSPNVSAPNTNSDIALYRKLSIVYSGETYLMRRRHFGSTFTFFVFRESLTPNRFAYRFSEPSARVMPKEDVDANLRNLFRSPTGELLIAFCETNALNMLHHTWTSTTNRYLEISVPDRMVCFLSLDTNGRTISIRHGIATNTSRNHKVMVTWDTTGASMNVDGDRVAYPTNWR